MKASVTADVPKHIQYEVFYVKKIDRKSALEMKLFTLCEGIAACENKVTYEPELDPKPKVSVLPSKDGQADLGQCGCYTTAPADCGWFRF